MPSVGSIMLAWLLAAIAASTLFAGSATSQSLSPERRLVEAFRKFCVATAAEPVRVHAAIDEMVDLSRPDIISYGSGDVVWSTEILDSIGRTDPHQRLLITFGSRPGVNMRSRICQVNVPWGEKAKLVSEVVTSLNLADGTSSVVREGQYDTDLTRWKTRIVDTEAVIELGMPTYSGAAGRALTLSLTEGQ
jgi:hypothetical protein